MLLHWLTTGWRSLISNPLFSLITIISLSIGAAGALLVGANIRQHLSFDRWVPDSEHVFLVTRTQDMSQIMQGMRIEGTGFGRPSSVSPGKLGEAIAGQIPGLVSTARMFRGASLLPPDPSLPTTPPLPGEPPRTPPPGSVYVDPGFFEMFGLEFVEGSAAALEEPNGVIITQTAARRIFGEASPMGQMVEGASKRQFRVVGVVGDLPVATHLRFEALGSVRLLQQIVESDRASQPPTPGMAGPGFTPSTFDNWNRGSNAALYLRTDSSVDPDTFATNARQMIQAVADERSKESNAGSGMTTFAPAPMMPSSWNYNVVPLLDIHLGGPDLTGLQTNGDIVLLSTLAAAAIALLVVSAFNYVTLSLARSLRRRREVAVRKVLGADQGALVRHYISESAIVTAISLMFGFLLAQFLHPWFARTIGQPETLFDLFDPTFLAGALIVFVLLALAVGAYPAFYLANTRPRTALGEGGAASPGRIGQMVTGGLMGLQISAATGLLIISLTMAAQARYIETRDLGYEVADRYQLIIPCSITERTAATDVQAQMRRCQTASQQVLNQMPELGKPAYFSGGLMSDIVTLQPFGRSAKGEKLGEASQMGVDTEFLQTMGAHLIAGRLFDSASAYDRAQIEYSKAMQARMRTTVQTDGGGRTMVMQSFDETSGTPPKRPEKVPVVITRAMLAPLGADTPEKALGMQFFNQPYSQYPYEVIGVVEDWNQRPLKAAITPLFFVPTDGRTAVVEIPKDEVEATRNKLNESWKAISGSTNQVILRPLQQSLEANYRADFLLMGAVTSFALVAIAVAGMGVFGLSSFEMRRRVREIGIRKALGASPYGVAALAIGRALMFAGIACLIAWPIGFYIANEWLSGFVYRTGLGWAVLPLASVAVIAFVGVAVSFSALRAAAVRPGMALRV
jgi:putative ABC transport system permease protein